MLYFQFPHILLSDSSSGCLLRFFRLWKVLFGNIEGERIVNMARSSNSLLHNFMEWE